MLFLFVKPAKMLSGGKNYLTSHDCLPTVIFRLLLYCPLLLSDSCCRAFSVFLLNTNLPVFLRRLRMFRESVLCVKLLSERKEKSDVENVTFGMFLCVHMACIDTGRNKRDFTEFRQLRSRFRLRDCCIFRVS